MENTKVVVMGAEDVRAMRKAHKEAEAAYFEAKVGALEFVADEMKRTGAEYTAAELSCMCGLTSGEIAAQMNSNGWCRAARDAGIYSGSVQTGVRHNELTFVRVMPDGRINPDQTMTVIRKQTIYKMRPDKSAKSTR